MPSTTDSKWINITEKKLWIVTLILTVSYPIMFLMSWFSLSGFIHWGGGLCEDAKYWSLCVHGFAIAFTLTVGQPLIGFFLIIFIGALIMRFQKIDWIQVTQKWKLKIKGTQSEELIVDYPLWSQEPVE